MFWLEFVFEVVFKIISKQYSNSVQNSVQNRVWKIKKIDNKNISFLKITDSKKRNIIVNEFLKTRQNIQQNLTCRWLEHTRRIFKALLTSYGHAKIFKKGLVSEWKPITEGMKNSPKAITFPQYPFITAHDDDGEEEGDVFIGDIAEQY